jgi:hypothetical protein
VIEMYKSYNDLCREIEWFKDQIEILKVERQDWWRKGVMPNKVKFKNAIENIDRVSVSLDTYEKALEIRQEQKERLDKIINGFEGIEYKVAYRKYVKNMTLQEIAEDLDYTHEWIRSVHAKMVKKHTFTLQT